jgi:hypothetical protein
MKSKLPLIKNKILTNSSNCIDHYNIQSLKETVYTRYINLKFYSIRIYIINKKLIPQCTNK